MILGNVMARIERFEGRTTWMYLDTAGVVTCGVGHALATAQAAIALPWSRPEAIVRADYARVQSAPRGRRALFYEQFSESRLPEFEIDRLRNSDVSRFLSQIERTLPELLSWPDAAQEAALDIAFNCGVAGLLRFHHMLEAIRRREWEIAAAESHRPQVSDARNHEIASLLADLALPEEPAAAAL